MPYKDPNKRTPHQRQNSKKSYKANQQKVAARAALTRERQLAWLEAFKGKLTCQRCGESDPVCLEFHHRDMATKKKPVSRMIGCGTEVILAEIAKCDVLCANCHRKAHREMRQLGVSPKRGPCTGISEEELPLFGPVSPAV